MKTIDLPEVTPGKPGGMSLEQAISGRRSLRRFSTESLSLSDLSYLLYYSCGITDPRHGLRAAPSAGATYPIELYPVVNNVRGLAPGIYHYLVDVHGLGLVREGDFSAEMSQAALNERMMRQAGAVLVMSAVSERTAKVYRERAHRYVQFEAGHIAQNICLAATSLGLGSCAIGAFRDEEFNRLLGLDGQNESVLYMMAVGKVQGEGK